MECERYVDEERERETEMFFYLDHLLCTRADNRNGFYGEIAAIDDRILQHLMIWKVENVWKIFWVNRLRRCYDDELSSRSIITLLFLLSIFNFSQAIICQRFINKRLRFDGTFNETVQNEKKKRKKVVNGTRNFSVFFCSLYWHKRQINRTHCEFNSIWWKQKTEKKTLPFGFKIGIVRFWFYVILNKVQNSREIITFYLNGIKQIDLNCIF